MKCEICGVAEAQVFIQQSDSTGRTGLRLCLACARDCGLSRLDGDLSASVRQLLAAAGSPLSAAGESTRCPRCGAALKDLRRRGVAGCAACWEHFGDRLAADRPTGDYRGRLPLRLEAARTARADIALLKRRLADALAAEDYESAAAWRDRLRALERGPAADA